MNPYIFTNSGQKFYYLDPQPGQIDLGDIAHALSHICRFVGHTNEMYSVAQHSILVAEMIPGGSELKLAALLHDAPEAYIGDMSSPLKQIVNGVFKAVEAKILAAVYAKFGLPFTEEPPTIKLYDKAACVLEHRALFTNPKPDELGITGDALKMGMEGWVNNFRSAYVDYFAEDHGRELFTRLANRWLSDLV